MVKEIPLSQGQIALVHESVYEEVIKYNWYAQKSLNTYYAVNHRRINKKDIYIFMHRFVWELVNGKENQEYYIDHIDGNGLNNDHTTNLREATHQQNMCNTRKRENCSSEFKGVHWCDFYKKWKAEIQANGQKYHIGYFDSEIMAANEYNLAAIKYHGEFANLNDLSEYNLNEVYKNKVSHKIGDEYTSKYRGASLNKTSNKWECRLKINGKNECFGSFENEKDAALVRDYYALKHFERVKLNFEEQPEEVYLEALSKSSKNRKTTSKIKGVYFNKDSQKWHARITINGKRKSIGFFNTEEEAAKAIKDYLQ